MNSDSHAGERALWLDRVMKGWEAYNKGFVEGKGSVEEAVNLFRQATETLREAGDELNLPLALAGLGSALHALGGIDDLLEASSCYEQEGHLWESMKASRQLALSVTRHQAVLRDLALLQPEKGLEYVEKGLAIGEKAMNEAKLREDRKDLATVTHTTADLCMVLARIDPECMASHLEVAFDLYSKALDIWEHGEEDGTFVGEGRVSQAGESRAGEASEEGEGRAICLMGMAEAYIMLGKNLEGAQGLLDDAACYYERLGPNSYHMGHIKSLYGSLFAAAGHREKAVGYFRESREIFRLLGFVE